MENINPDSPFHRELIQLMGDSAAVRRVHGDFSPHNMILSDGKVWLFDWEEYSDAGPCRTDEIRFELALRMKPILASPARQAELFAQRHGRGRDPAWPDAMLALAFLHGARVMEARALIDHWKD